MIIFWLNQQVFVESLPTKCVSLNGESCKARTILTDLNPDQLKYYPFMTSLDKCHGSCNVVDNYLQKYLFPGKNDINVKVFNMIASI